MIAVTVACVGFACLLTMLWSADQADWFYVHREVCRHEYDYYAHGRTPSRGTKL